MQKWLYVDTRVLALFRIIFGFLGLLDVLRRYHLIDVFYSTSGMNFRRQVTSKYSIKYIPQFKKWLKNTDYFSKYSGREVVEVKVWQLLESSPNLNMAPEDRPKVRKIELPGIKKENRKSKNKYYKKTEKKPIRKN
jgi:hypothetical protein